ncbi:SCO2400 family protein [Streptomyces californicus]
MDYCHPCRRHLNGALACAGCGTPAQALSPWASSEATGVTEATGPTPDGANGAYGTASPADAPDVRPPSRRATTRASRPGARGPRPGARRRAARGGHRRRGRTVLFGALGLLLAAGALSLTELAMEPDRDDSAAEFVRDAPGGPTEAAPTEPSAAAPRDPAPAGTRGGATTGPGPDAAPTDDRAEHPGPTGTASPDAPGPDEPAASTSPEAPGPSAPSDSPPADPPPPDAPEQPTTAPAPPPPPAEPTDPTPAPSPTCTRFLWWCT